MDLAENIINTESDNWNGSRAPRNVSDSVNALNIVYKPTTVMLVLESATGDPAIWPFTLNALRAVSLRDHTV
jgi:hypothetical protein